jgi:hypothetical protein
LSSSDVEEFLNLIAMRQERNRKIFAEMSAGSAAANSAILANDKSDLMT